MEEKEFTLSIFTEDKIGLISRVVAIFTRRHLNLSSLNASESSIKGIYRFTIVLDSTEVMVKKLVGQLDKQVDIIKAFYYENKDVVYQELALFKVPTHIFSNGHAVENLIRSYNARILSIEPEYIVIEKTGHKNETDALLAELEKTGVYEFVRSGRVAVTKPMEQLNAYLKSVGIEELN
jgi:acetolactate synthase-1/3 small subunit